MKLFHIIPFLLLSCGHAKDEPTSNPLGDVQAKGSFYASHLSDSIYRARCDKLTFKSVLSTAIVQDLRGFELAPGEWKRDLAPCYPDESNSEVPFEALVGVLHHILTTKDCDMATRLASYGDANDWQMGQGESDAHLLASTIWDVRGKVCNALRLAPIPSANEILKGFRGHILAGWIWLRGRIDGRINAAELEGLAKLADASPEDPFYLALKARYDDGDQTPAINVLLNSPEFPSGEAPMQDGVFGWGSAPAMVYYLITLAVIEGT